MPCRTMRSGQYLLPKFSMKMTTGIMIKLNKIKVQECNPITLSSRSIGIVSIDGEFASGQTLTGRDSTLHVLR